MQTQYRPSIDFIPGILNVILFLYFRNKTEFLLYKYAATVFARYVLCYYIKCYPSTSARTKDADYAISAKSRRRYF